MSTPPPSSGWNERRWTIEEYFKVLKSGMRIEDRKLDDADDLRKCLAFDAITAVHVFNLERMARDQPETSADAVVTEDHIAALYIHLQYHAIIPARPPPGTVPDIRTFAVDLARLAGFHPRKQQPLPGTKKIWRAYVILAHSIPVYRAMKEPSMIKP